MKKYKLEIASLLLQLAVFYGMPNMVSKMGPIMMVMLMLVLTCIISSFLGCWSNCKYKYLYPVVVAVLFLPSVVIYYNSTAWAMSLWHMIVSALGIGFGWLVGKVSR